jgi:drug/metabolite transporter (DMT)-like permease
VITSLTLAKKTLHPYAKLIAGDGNLSMANLVNKLNDSKIFFYVLMGFLLLDWGFEYVVIKLCLSEISPMGLLFFKYAIAAIILTTIKLVKDRSFPLKKRDIPTIIFCSITGEILYFFGEWSALSYLKVSTVTIFLALVPIFSMIGELILFKKKPTWLMLVMAAISVIGVGVIVGDSLRSVFSGKIIGFLLVLIAVISWNFYNFLTDKLGGTYKPFDLTVLQLICTGILTFPLMLASKPNFVVIFTDPKFIAGLLYLSVVSASIGFVIYVKAIETIGPTPCAMFSNFLPVSSSIFGFLLLGESLTFLQLIGGVVVIASGAVFIASKSKLDHLSETTE